MSYFTRSQRRGRISSASLASPPATSIRRDIFRVCDGTANRPGEQESRIGRPSRLADCRGGLVRSFARPLARSLIGVLLALPFALQLREQRPGAGRPASGSGAEWRQTCPSWLMRVRGRAARWCQARAATQQSPGRLAARRAAHTPPRGAHAKLRSLCSSPAHSSATSPINLFRFGLSLAPSHQAGGGGARVGTSKTPT